MRVTKMWLEEWINQQMLERKSAYRVVEVHCYRWSTYVKEQGPYEIRVDLKHPEENVVFYHIYSFMTLKEMEFHLNRNCKLALKFPLHGGDVKIVIA